jgi:phosphatidate cytidylyltransferase
MSGLPSRVLVVAAGLPIVLGLAWAGGWIMFAGVGIASVLALHELYHIGRSFRPLVLAGYAGTVACLLGIELGGIAWMAGGLLLTLPLAFFFVLFAETRQSPTVSVSFTMLGAVWIGLGLGHLLLIRAIPEDGRLAIFAVLLAVFATDTGGYLVGRTIGRHRLAPAVSPGKTWEGFVAGAITGIFVTWIALYKTGFADGWRSLVLGAVIVVAATIGDLFESLVKRDLRVKDTGRLLGGHGGILDRIDSLLAAAPAAYYTLAAFGEVPL